MAIVKGLMSGIEVLMDVSFFLILSLILLILLFGFGLIALYFFAPRFVCAQYVKGPSPEKLCDCLGFEKSGDFLLVLGYRTHCIGWRLNCDDGTGKKQNTVTGHGDVITKIKTTCP